MAMELNGSDIMENLWQTMPKTEDGQHLKFSELEVEQLWAMGFTDAKRVPIEQWKKIMSEYKKADGTYVLSKTEFFSLDAYRYKGEVHVPFNAMEINEGYYTEEGLDDLIESSIMPSCVLSREKVVEFFSMLKKDFRNPDGLILIRRPAKEKIAALIAAYPSPLRNLELILDEMFKSGGELPEALREPESAKGPQAPAAPVQKQGSSFSSSPTSKSEAKAKELNALTKAKKKEEVAADDSAPKVMLKSMMRSRRGFRG